MENKINKQLLEGCITSLYDFKINFPSLLTSLNNSNAQQQLDFIKNLSSIILNDTTTEATMIFAFLLLAKICEKNLPKINAYIIDDEDLLGKLFNELVKGWNIFKDMPKSKELTPKDILSKNFLRLLLELVAYIGKHYSNKSVKIEDMLEVVKAREVILPNNFYIMEIDSSKIDLTQPIEIDFGYSKYEPIPGEDDDGEEVKKDPNEINISKNKIGDLSIDSKTQSQRISPINIANQRLGTLKRGLIIKPEEDEPKTERSNKDDISQSSIGSQHENKKNRLYKMKSPAEIFKKIQQAKQAAITDPNNNNNGGDATPRKILRDLEELEKGFSRDRSQNKRNLVEQIKEDIKKSYNTSGKRPPNYLESLGMVDPTEVNQQLEKQVKELKAENDNIKQELEYLKRKNNQSAIEDLLSQLERMQSQITKFQQENTKLKKEYTKKAQETESIKSQNDALHDQIHQLTREGGQVDGYIAEIKELRTQNLEVGALHNTIKEITAKFEQQIKELTDKNASLQNCIDDLNAQKNDLNKRISDLEESNKYLIIQANLKDKDNVKKIDIDVNEIVNRTKKSILDVGPKPNTSIEYTNNRSKTEIDMDNQSKPSYLRSISPHQGIHSPPYPIEANKQGPAPQLNHNPKQRTPEPNSLNTSFSSTKMNNNRNVTPKKEIFLDDIINTPILDSPNLTPISRKPKGILVPDRYLKLEESKIFLNSPEFIGDLTSFKLACLMTRAAFPLSEKFQVGMTMASFFNNLTNQHNIRLGLYFGNMGNISVERFYAKLVYIDPNLTAQIENPSSGSIMPQGQTKLVYSFGIRRYPFSVPIINGSYSLNNKIGQFKMILPITINKFMNFVSVDTEDNFKYKWRTRKNFLLRSEEIELDKNIVIGAQDFLGIFEGLINLNSKKKSNNTNLTNKFVGIFELDIPNVEYYIKIIAYLNSKVVFQICCPENSLEVGKFIIRTLVFLFSKQK